MHDFKPRQQTSDGQRVDPWHAIATMYRGYEFRSKQEARYAVLFDQMGWKWAYEPVDLGGWIPDFWLGERGTLVEVKAFRRLDEFGEAKAKIIKSGCKEPVILFGADPTWIEDPRKHCPHNGVHCGWLFDPVDGITHDLHFGRTQANGQPGLCTMDSGWVNYVWNETGKPARVDVCDMIVERYLIDPWASACNTTKWLPVKDKQ